MLFQSYRCIFQGFIAQIHEYRQRIITRTVSSNQKKTCQPQRNILETFTGIIIKKLSARDLFSQKTPLRQPIQSKIFGSLTIEQAVDIVIKQNDHFHILQKELREFGVITNQGIQEHLCSLLQRRIDEIDAEMKTCHVNKSTLRKIDSDTVDSRPRQTISRLA